MINIKASAPGKVIVAGEYAVLDGAPAICMAVNRRAHVSVSSSAENHHTVSAPGFSGHSDSFGSVSEIARSYPLLAAVWQELQIETPDFLNIVLDSRGFSDSNAGKIGIGSSAALTVALTAALDHCFPLAGQSRDVRSVAMAAHGRLQGGAGSGADIACSFAGGITEYRKGESVSTKLSWPPGLRYALLWSGVPADTSAQLGKLDVAEKSDSWKALDDSANAVAEAWHSGEPAKVLLTLREFSAKLRCFDVDQNLGIFDAGHAELADSAESFDLVYKPCGAGGGDLGIAVSSKQSELAAFVDTARRKNFKAMDLAIDSLGVVVEGHN